jgi:hypothetical protein
VILFATAAILVIVGCLLHSGPIPHENGETLNVAVTDPAEHELKLVPIASGEVTTTPLRHHVVDGPRCVVAEHDDDHGASPTPASLERGCSRGRTIRCKGGKLGRALVVYILKTADDDPTSVLPEAWSANVFSRFSEFSASGTILFDAVDVVVARLRRDIKIATLRVHERNVKLVDLPGDITRDGYSCAQGMLVMFLGGARKLSRSYRFVAVLHSGVHGPFQHRLSPSWLDVLGMGGQRFIDRSTPPLMVSPSLFVDAGNVVGLYSSLLPAHTSFLLQHCPASSHGNQHLQQLQHNKKEFAPSGWWLHGLVRNVTLHSPQWGQQYREHGFLDIGMTNNKSNLERVCSAMFLKHSGPFTSAVDDQSENDIDEVSAALTKHQFAIHERKGSLTFLMLRYPWRFLVQLTGEYGVFTRVGLDVALSTLPVGHLPRPRIAVCFFGLVKNMFDTALAAMKRNVADPITALGDVSVFLHTFHVKSFVNPANNESASIDQDTSIHAIRRLFSSASTFRTQIDSTDDAHRFFGPTAQYLRFGGSWEHNSQLSVHYYLRQQYSLIRATEMWTGVKYTASPVNATTALVVPPHQYDCVIFLRPDLSYDTPIPQHALERMCSGGGSRGQRDVVISAVEYNGFHDRVAFGTPMGMLLYGLRGLRLSAYVRARQVVHAETYLARFLCENNVTVHLAHWATRRLRGNGRYSDGPEREQTNVFFKSQVTSWADMQRNQHSRQLRRDGVPCVPRATWA